MVGFAGYSGAGKTTLLEGLIPALTRRGQRVSVLKHAHHGFDIDQPGKDSWRHRQAGAREVLLASERRLALLRECDRPPSLPSLIARLDPRADWVLVEGFKDSRLLKVEVWRAANGKPAHYPEDGDIIALATDDSQALPAPCGVPVFDLQAHDPLADWLLEQAARFDYSQNTDA